jgi:hypothetical protein
MGIELPGESSATGEPVAPVMNAATMEVASLSASLDQAARPTCIDALLERGALGGGELLERGE